MKNYVEILKKYAEENKISQSKISKALGVNKNTTCAWFNGKNYPTLKFQKKIEDFLRKNNIVNEEKTIITRKEYDSRWEIVKLESVEEIIDALNNEEILISDNFLIKIEKGIIVKYDLMMKPLFINPALDFNYSYSVKRKKPIVLAVLKRFKDESGDIWYVYKEDSNFPSYEALNENSGITRYFYKNGKSLDSEINLIEEI